MSIFLKNQRTSGILAHFTSLPSDFGIGDIGRGAETFLIFLQQAGQKYWQILPTGPTSLIFDSSPYMSTSAFAGSPLLICPHLLKKMGFIQTITNRPETFSPYTTDFLSVTAFKSQLLQRAFQNFSDQQDDQFDKFTSSTRWLHDYASFMTLKTIYQNKAWYEWPEKFVKRDPKALAGLPQQYPELFNYFLFEQYVFSRQWLHLREQAADRDIKLIGDIPIYVSLDSADVWANQDIFELHAHTRRPVRVSGVPPDYFSKTGQRWGNPLYRWNSKDRIIKATLLDWWENRFRETFRLVDAARIDHFRGFESYWAVPEKSKNAIDGSWVKGPGVNLFRQLKKRLGPLNIIAEDLGEITPAVINLRKELDFPGMKVLQFAFDGDPSNSFLPFNFDTDHCVVYTGTHDNNTTVGWFLSDIPDEQARAYVKQCCNRELHDNRGIHEDLLYLSMSSIAKLAITPLQDILGFGGDCRMNTPGVPSGNWKWRCAPENLGKECAEYLKSMTILTGRLG
ncbi:MAG: 4-alpha-glucanotransferase [Desulfobulbaceae bacterium]|mgnify:CR=1 FL=1|nr:MAG: 4-alpha-glucanotransferase [Desulfobulbaceae bacterium]